MSRWTNSEFCRCEKYRINSSKKCHFFYNFSNNEPSRLRKVKPNTKRKHRLSVLFFSLLDIARQLLVCIFHSYHQSLRPVHFLSTKKSSKVESRGKGFHLISEVLCSIGGKISSHRLNYRMKNVREFIEGRYIDSRVDRLLFHFKFSRLWHY